VRLGELERHIGDGVTEAITAAAAGRPDTRAGTVAADVSAVHHAADRRVAPHTVNVTNFSFKFKQPNGDMPFIRHGSWHSWGWCGKGSDDT